MSLSKQQRKKIAQKAVETRRVREKQRKNRERAIKATGTREESEDVFKLAKVIGVSANRIIHHNGLPDLIVVKNDGKIAFYEVKPKKGRRDRIMLNNKQKETVKHLLKMGFEIFMVRYAKRRKEYYYDSPEPITAKNLHKFCLSAHR